jgi:hypothetical protein
MKRTTLHDKTEKVGITLPITLGALEQYMRGKGGK